MYVNRAGYHGLMNLRRIAGSLATRIILLGISFVLVGTLLRATILTQYLREDISTVVAEQQLTLASYIARDIEHKLNERQELLHRLATTVPESLLAHPEQMRGWLATRYELQAYFSDGFLVAAMDGSVITDYPRQSARAGLNYADMDYFQTASGGQFAIGRPALEPAVMKPVLPMAVPIRDASGAVRAVLCGITALDAAGFLNFNTEQRIGSSGGFLLISPRDRLFVAATDPTMVLQPTPPDGVNPLHDRAMQGYRGSGVTVNAKGVEEISAMASVPSTGWFVVARIPTSEALAVVTRAKNFVARNSVLSVLVFLLLSSVGLMYVFRPLLRAADQADRMTRGEAPLEPLVVVRQDEVGHLTEAFNRLLLKLQASQAEMSHMAHHDVLTGLPNRAMLNDRLAQALARAVRNRGHVALLYVDLDRFKPINDSFGHETGDAALRQIARRLQDMVRGSDTLARVGGDEFVILLPDLAGGPESAHAAATAVATKCLDAVEQPIALHGEQHRVGASIGIALGDGTLSPHALQAAADTAMYQAKQSGGHRFCVTVAHGGPGAAPQVGS